MEAILLQCYLSKLQNTCSSLGIAPDADDSQNDDDDDTNDCELSPPMQTEFLELYTLMVSRNDDTYFVDYIRETMSWYIESDTLRLSSESFELNMYNDIKDLCKIFLEQICERVVSHEVFEIVYAYYSAKSERKLYSVTVPRRSYKTTFIRQSPNVPTIRQKLEYIQSKPQPEQRTSEWYEFRRNKISASNAYKAFESQSMQNQLIYEKCKPNTIRSGHVNTESAMHHGQRFEPLSVMIYEHKYDTKVGEYGCVAHDTYGFIAASPDGINIDPSSERYGRMLEIKNVVSRVITGNPKKEYWIQMQLQMETCDLNECDFLETKFVEYETEDDFIEDSVLSVDYTNEGYHKGVFIQFCNQENQPVYEYGDLLKNTIEELDQWRDDVIIRKQKDGLVFVRTIFWKLEVCSCVLVLRNKLWFQHAIQQLRAIWDAIENDRIHGFEHRAPKKKMPKCKSDIIPKCLLNIDDLLNNDVVDNTTKTTTTTTTDDNAKESGPVHTNSSLMRIRTESMDETQTQMHKENKS